MLRRLHRSLSLDADGAIGGFRPPRDGTGAVAKHPVLAGRAGGPRPAELAGERGGAFEHSVHAPSIDLPNLPAREVAGERGGATERT